MDSSKTGFIHPEIVETDTDFVNRLKSLITFRALFAALLLGSTIIQQISTEEKADETSLLILYLLTSAILALSLVYALLLKRFKSNPLYIYTQITLDTIFVSLIIYMTGSYFSLFSFLYLVIIIYAGMFIYRSGSLVMAALCSIQYGVMVDLEYYEIIQPVGSSLSLADMNIPWSHVLYRVMIIMVACFAVAFLSSLLTEQERSSKKELRKMEDHVQRVKKMAAMGEMAAGLAHEIKNPLASIRSAIQMLQDEVDCKGEDRQLMNIVLRETDRLSSLVTNFLLFAKPSAGKAEKVELASALEEIVQLFSKDLKRYGNLKLNKHLHPNIWIVIDPTHLRQIFWNLMVNAAESVTEDGEISLIMKPGKGREVKVMVVDNGCGIPREMINRIFDPFVSTKKNGTGLGLSIVHRITDSYGFNLDVESKANKGTIFYLTFKTVHMPSKA